MSNKLLFTALSLALLLFSCGKDSLKTYDCTGITPTYTTDIKPIFDDFCATSGCHDSVKKEKGYDLSSYAGSKSANGDNILGSIQQAAGYDAMPKGSSKLSETQIQKIYCWIENGRPE